MQQAEQVFKDVANGGGSEDMYRSVYDRVGSEWTRLQGDQPQLADDIAIAGHLADRGLLEERFLPRSRERGGKIEFRRV